MLALPESERTRKRVPSHTTPIAGSSTTPQSELWTYDSTTPLTHSSRTAAVALARLMSEKRAEPHGCLATAPPEMRSAGGQAITPGKSNIPTDTALSQFESEKIIDEHSCAKMASATLPVFWPPLQDGRL
jgi:hypothetical protein